MFVVYCLFNPITNQVFYVGMTSNIADRYLAHIRLQEVNREKNAVIAELIAGGLLPIPRTLQVCQDEREARQAERNWIAAFLEIDQPLTNSERVGKR